MARFGVSVAAILVAVLTVANASADDSGIVRQISEELLRQSHSGKLREFDILLAATEGKVWLAGYVSTREQLELVEKIAGIIDGVKEVDIQLTIGDPRASGSTEAEALKPVNANAEQCQVGSSKAGIPAVLALSAVANPPQHAEGRFPFYELIPPPYFYELIPPPLSDKANARKCSNDQGLSASASQPSPDPSPHVESKNTEQHQGPRTVQVLIRKPVEARVQWDLKCDESVEAHASVVPFRRDLAVSRTHQLRLSSIPGRDGLEVSASLRILPISSHTESYVADMAIPVSFTNDDLDQVISGKDVTKVVFLDEKCLGDFSLQLVSTRFLAGYDPRGEVANDRSVLAIVHVPAILFESKLHESTCTESAAQP